MARCPPPARRRRRECGSRSVLDAGVYGIFDAFPDEPARQAHLSGQIAAALMKRAPELLSQPPVIERVDVIAAKLP